MSMVPPELAQQAESSHSKHGYRWVVLAAATIAQAAASFVMQGLGVLAGFLQEAFHLSTSEVGLLIAASAAAPILALPIVGDLLDRQSERAIVGLGAAILAAGLIFSILAPQFAVLLVCLFIVGAGYSTTQPGGSKSVTTWFRGRQLGLAMGIRQAGLPLGGAAAAAILPIVASFWGWRVAFAVGAAVAFGGGLVFSALYRSPPGIDDVGRRTRPAMSITSLLTMLRQPWMRGVVLSGTTLVSAQFAILTYFMLFLRDDHSIQLVDGAWLMFAAQACGVAGRVILAAWSDRPGTSRFRLVASSMIAVAAGMLMLALAHSYLSLSAFVVIAAWLGFFGLGWYGPWVAFVAEVSPPESLGLALGTAMALNQIAIFAAPPLLGLLHDLTGGYVAVWGCTAVLLACAVWGTRSVR
jgi:predicted MFS family arabinose efflux permease